MAIAHTTQRRYKMSKIFVFSLILVICSSSRPFALTHLYPKVALTRDSIGNKRLENLLALRGIKTIHLPCIIFANGPENIEDHLKSCDIIAITSLQVFITI